MNPASLHSLVQSGEQLARFGLGGWFVFSANFGADLLEKGLHPSDRTAILESADFGLTGAFCSGFRVSHILKLGPQTLAAKLTMSSGLPKRITYPVAGSGL